MSNIAWQNIKLGDYIEEGKEKNKDSNDLKVYSVSNTRGFVPSEEYFDKQVFSKDTNTYKLVHEEDFAYNPYRINVGSLGMLSEEKTVLVSPAYIVFRVIKKNDLIPGYLLHFLKSSYAIKQIKKYTNSRGSVRRSLVYKDLAKFDLLLPPIKEQESLISIIYSIRDAIVANKKELYLSMELRETLKLGIFTQGLETKSKKTDELPLHWQIVKLEDLLSDNPQNGIYKPLTDYGEGTPIVRIDDFDNQGNFLNTELKRVRLKAQEIDTYSVSENDILVNRVNSLSHLGKSVLIKGLRERIVFESNMMKIRVDEIRILPEYLVQYLQTDLCRKVIKSKAKRAIAQSSINQGDLKALLIPLPLPEEQKLIIDLLDASDTKNKLLEKYMLLLKELQASIFERLLERGLKSI